MKELKADSKEVNSQQVEELEAKIKSLEEHLSVLKTKEASLAIQLNANETEKIDLTAKLE